MPQWCFCIEFLDQPSATKTESAKKVDYREVLNDADFAVYAELRELRKKLAEDAGLPVFAVFTNEQLARMVQKRVQTLDELRKFGTDGCIELLINPVSTPLRFPCERLEWRVRITFHQLKRNGLHGTRLAQTFNVTKQSHSGIPVMTQVEVAAAGDLAKSTIDTSINQHFRVDELKRLLVRRIDCL